MVGLDAAGKTTILYKLKLGEIVTTIPTIGMTSGEITGWLFVLLFINNFSCYLVSYILDLVLFGLSHQIFYHIDISHAHMDMSRIHMECGCRSCPYEHVNSIKVCFIQRTAWTCCSFPVNLNFVMLLCLYGDICFILLVKVPANKSWISCLKNYSCYFFKWEPCHYCSQSLRHAFFFFGFSYWASVIILGWPAGFNVETVEYKNISFTVWDVGGQDKVYGRLYLWFHSAPFFFNLMFVYFSWKSIWCLYVNV